MTQGVHCPEATRSPGRLLVAASLRSGQQRCRPGQDSFPCRSNVWQCEREVSIHKCRFERDRRCGPSSLPPCAAPSLRTEPGRASLPQLAPVGLSHRPQHSPGLLLCDVSPADIPSTDAAIATPDAGGPLPPCPALACCLCPCLCRPFDWSVIVNADNTSRSSTCVIALSLGQTATHSARTTITSASARESVTRQWLRAHHWLSPLEALDIFKKSEGDDQFFRSRVGRQTVLIHFSNSTVATVQPASNRTKADEQATKT